MNIQETYEFGSFRVDAHERLLFHGTHRIHLRGKAFDVLAELLRGGGRALSKDELLRRVWRDVAVEEANLTVAVSQLRKVLREAGAGDDYIETLPGRGYRFVQDGRALRRRAQRQSAALLPEVRGTVPSPSVARNCFVGREAELTTLRAARDDVQRGSHRALFFVGDAGLGKTALLEKFCESMESAGTHLVARASCVDVYGAQEPYLPVLTALTRLCKGPAGPMVLDIFERVAPTWARLLPGFFSPRRLEALARRAASSSPPRMLQEAATALELISDRRPVVWCMEDLHWADRPTLELLTYWARNLGLSHFLLLGSCRPNDERELAFLMNDSSLRGWGEKRLLGPLTIADVQRYLDLRFAGRAFPPELAALIHDRTCGTPLFVVQWLDQLIDKGLLNDRAGTWLLGPSLTESLASVPSTTAQSIEMQFDRLQPGERLLLEVACVAGDQFAVVAVADVLERDGVAVERCCMHWAERGHFLYRLGDAEWPDGTRTTLFSFAHSLYREVLYQGLGATARARWHQRLGSRLESAYGQRAREIAAELALHFERGGDHAAAARYLLLAGNSAQERLAYAAAVEQLRRGLSHAALVADGPAKLCLELDLQSALGTALSASSSHTSPEVRATYARVRQLSEQIGNTPLTALFGAWMALFMRGEYGAAEEFALQLSPREMSSERSEPAAAAQVMAGLSALYRGYLMEARQKLHDGLAVLDFDRRKLPGPFELDPVFIAYNVVWADWIAGYPDSALAMIQRGLASSEGQSQSPGRAYLLHFASVLHEERGEHDRAAACAQATLPWCESMGFLSALAQHQILAQKIHSGALSNGASAQENLVSRMIAFGTGVAVTRPSALLTRSFMREGRLQDALRTLRSGFEYLTAKQERWWEAELHRLQGELWILLEANGQSAAACDRGVSDAECPEDCFQRALEVAQAQGARSHELRAAVSLARRWAAGGRADSARKLLGNVYAGFDEGLETRDLRSARALLEELARRSSSA
jgi:DNA-binding winged helix-turn-helix (wHTH) protein